MDKDTRLNDDDDVSLTSLFHACTGRTVAPLQLPDSQSFYVYG